MTRPNVMKHGYNALLAAVMTVVAMLFNPGIPWWAWVLAFLVFLAAAEVFSRTFAGSAAGERKSSHRLFVFAAACAVAIIMSVAVMLM